MILYILKLRYKIGYKVSKYKPEHDIRTSNNAMKIFHFTF